MSTIRRPGDFPPGLSLDPISGIISGTPLLEGTYAFPVVVYDGAGNSRLFNADVEVIDFVPPTAFAQFSQGDETVQYLTVGVAALWTFGITVPEAAGQTITAAAVSIVPSSPGLPSGFALGSAVIGMTGLAAGAQAIGSPTAAAPESYGQRRMTVQIVWTIAGSFGELSGVTRFPINLRFQPQMTVEGSYGLVIVNRQNSVPLLRDNGDPGIQGGHEPRRVTISSGTLPAGLSLNATTGAIVGSPAQIGTWPISLRVEDAARNVRTLSNIQLRTDIIYEPPQFIGIPTNTSQTFERENGIFTLLPDYSGFSVRAFLPYQLEWVRTSGSTDIVPAAPASLTTGFNCNVPPGASRTAEFRIDIWDERTPRGQVQSAPITITATNAYASMALSPVPSMTVGGARKLVGPNVLYTALVPITGGVRPYGQIAVNTPQPMFGNVVATPRPSDGAILFQGASGPVAPAAAGTINFSATVTDGGGTPRVISRDVRCVNPPLINGDQFPRFRVGVASAFTYVAEAGNRQGGAGQAFSLSGSLPSGIAFSNGGLSASVAGTPAAPTAPGGAPVTLVYRDGLTASDYTNEVQISMSVFVEPAISVSIVDTTAPTPIGDSFVVEATPSAGASIVSISLFDVGSAVISPSLPAGVGQTVTVTGIREPQAIAIPQITATANDASGAPPVSVSFSFP